MKAGKAFAAGMVGGAVMSVLMAVARLLGMPIDFETMLGTVTGMDPNAAAWVLGLVMHLVISGAIGLCYALGFEYVSHRSGALPGVVFSLIHIVVGGLIMGAMPAIHPQIPETIAPPGAFLSAIGDVGVVSFVVLHAIYGAVVGVMYGPVLHPFVPSEDTTPAFRRPTTA